MRFANVTLKIIFVQWLESQSKLEKKRSLNFLAQIGRNSHFSRFVKREKSLITDATVGQLVSH